jgi:hypothetical protein
MVIIVSTDSGMARYDVPEDADIKVFSDVCRSMAMVAGYSQPQIADYLPDEEQLENQLNEAAAVDFEDEDDEGDDEGEEWKSPYFNRLQWRSNN